MISCMCLGETVCRVLSPLFEEVSSFGDTVPLTLEPLFIFRYIFFFRLLLEFLVKNINNYVSQFRWQMFGIKMLINDCHHEQVPRMIGHFWCFWLRELPFALCTT